MNIGALGLKATGFYVWKQPLSIRDLEEPKWIDEPYNDITNWFVFDCETSLLIKTDCIEYQDLSRYLKKLKIRTETIAAPKNIFDFPEAVDPKFDQPIKIDSFNFRGLKQKMVLYITNSYMDQQSPTEDLKVDIKLKEIFDLDRGMIKNLKEKKISELKSKFPSTDFEATMINFQSYNIVPACFRSIEELYFDNLCIQEQAMGYSQLKMQHDALNNKQIIEDYEDNMDDSHPAER
jgi:hypothetical protein